MFHHKLENELRHLEKVLPHAGHGPFPHAYWRDRIAALTGVESNALYRSRVARLEELLAAMEKKARSRSAIPRERAA
ncbi:hypothetical protein LJ656_06665 [Paraburkholderia sp. MMS20-SJTR3]|uniref:Uncharacterized protein n=1 Tax=Paraburkholderia sejongensis TaxID=2886946 RepID=A0ABS8JQW8_9BURK|nr:hypothetical protein [Paraburkholderia sp. MMS20-SJTR3]MCC8392267.1 hypothetical protein [Paraburkholderia sp. MMS20-SJTR3]